MITNRFASAVTKYPLPDICVAMASIWNTSVSTATKIIRKTVSHHNATDQPLVVKLEPDHETLYPTHHRYRSDFSFYPFLHF
jgi:hypothetical protein